MSPTEAAYFAAFVDGEGTISLFREARKENRAGFRYVALLKVANTNLRGLQAVRELCGNGRLIFDTRSASTKRPTRRPCFHIRWTPNQIRHLLPQIRPHLLFKRRQCDLVLEYLDIASQGYKPTAHELARIEAIRAEVRTLNKRGTPEDFEPAALNIRDAKPSGRLAIKLAREAAQKRLI